MAKSVLEAVRRAAGSLLALALVRAEFASLELTLAVQETLRWLLWALVACVLGMLALIAVSATLVAVLWERMGWYSVGVLAVVYCVATVVFAMRLLQSLARAQPLLSQTFAELAKDRAALASIDANAREVHDGGEA